MNMNSTYFTAKRWVGWSLGGGSERGGWGHRGRSDLHPFILGSHPFLPQTSHLATHDLRPPEMLLFLEAAELRRELLPQLLHHPAIAVFVH